ncbi:hypothetical protein [Sediminibacterium goheungense]|nr:hypothetical protein [Sediminibacterium goheungense]
MMQTEMMGLTSLTSDELQETEGGFLPLLVLGVVFLAGCNSQRNQQSGGDHNCQINLQFNGPRYPDTTVIHCNGHNHTIVNK